MRPGLAKPVALPSAHCSKNAYENRSEASRIAKKLPASRAYRCDRCGLWHLTTMSAVERRRLKRSAA